MLPGSPWWPAVEMMLIMLPQRPNSIICLAVCLVNKNAPVSITSVCRRHSTSGMFRTPFVLNNVAPLIRMSMPPNASLAWSTAAVTWVSSVTSQAMAMARRPLAATDFAHCSA